MLRTMSFEKRIKENVADREKMPWSLRIYSRKKSKTQMENEIIEAGGKAKVTVTMLTSAFVMMSSLFVLIGPIFIIMQNTGF